MDILGDPSVQLTERGLGTKVGYRRTGDKKWREDPANAFSFETHSRHRIEMDSKYSKESGFDLHDDPNSRDNGRQYLWLSNCFVDLVELQEAADRRQTSFGESVVRETTNENED